MLKGRLIDSQVSKGADTGSWSPGSARDRRWGRVYTTALNGMSLSLVYQRRLTRGFR